MICFCERLARRLQVESSYRVFGRKSGRSHGVVFLNVSPPDPPAHASLRRCPALPYVAALCMAQMTFVRTAPRVRIRNTVATGVPTTCPRKQQSIVIRNRRQARCSRSDSNVKTLILPLNYVVEGVVESTSVWWNQRQCLTCVSLSAGVNFQGVPCPTPLPLCIHSRGSAPAPGEVRKRTHGAHHVQDRAPEQQGRAERRDAAPHEANRQHSPAGRAHGPRA